MKRIQKHSLTFISINIYIILLILLPKNIPNIFGIIPLRTTLTYLLFIIFMYDRYKNKIEINNFNFKWLWITYGIFIICTIPSIIVSMNKITTIYTIIKFISFILFLYVCIKIKLTKEEYKIIIKNIIILSVLKFIWGLIEYIFGINLFTIGAYKYPGSKGRIRCFFFNTIYYGAYINLIYIYLIYLFNIEKKQNNKIILAIILLLGYINLLLTFTRSSLLILYGTIFLLLIFLRKSILNKYVIGIGLICLIIGFMIPGTSTLILSSVNDTSKIVFKAGIFDKLLPDGGNADKDAEMGDYSLSHRRLFAKTGIAIGKDHMLSGIGFGSYIDYIKTDEFKQNYPKYKDVLTHPHSSYVLMFSETGILSVIAFTAFMIVLIINIIKSIKLNKDISYIILIITIGFYLVNIAAENMFYDTQIFPMYLLVIGLSLGYIINNKLVKE